MAVATALAIFLLFKHLNKAAALPYESTHRPCVEFILPVPATAQNVIYDVDRIDSNIDATSFAVELDTWSSPNITERTLRTITVSDTFNIGAQLCVPPEGSKRTNLQIATHGLIFDKRYWDVEVEPEEYSYVNAALDTGYSILTYDRLGTGKSDKPSAYKVVQEPLELDILRSITDMAHSGELLQHAQGLAEDEMKFEKFIHIGHSFGSFLTLAFITSYSNMSDGAVITGVLPSPESHIASLTSNGLAYPPETDPDLFHDFKSGYVVPETPSALQTGFFSTRANTETGVGGFDPKLLDWGFSVRQPGTVSEWLSLFGEVNIFATNFTGPIQFMEGEFDFLACGGDCNGQGNLTFLESVYPSAKNIDVYLQDGTGHGMTMHKGARKWYQVTFDWLDKNAL